MKDLKDEYDEIKAPKQTLDLLEETMNRASRDKQKARRRRKVRNIGMGIAAAFAVCVVLPNTNASVAYAMGNVPVLGNIFKVLTVREYSVNEARYQADVKVPEITSGEKDGQIKENLGEVNADIKKITDQLIQEFEEQKTKFEKEGYADLHISSNVICETDEYFSVELILYQGAGSGFERHKFYTIDKQSGKQIKLSDLFTEGSDYKKAVSDEIKAQMRANMKKDKKLEYWLDDKDIGEENNFKSISDDQNFYINAKGNLVIAFDEYEVAPGYMGCLEFEIDSTLVKAQLK